MREHIHPLLHPLSIITAVPLRPYKALTLASYCMGSCVSILLS